MFKEFVFYATPSFLPTLYIVLQRPSRNVAVYNIVAYSVPLNSKASPRGIKDSASPTSPAAEAAKTEVSRPDDCGSFIISNDEIQIEAVSETVERYADGIYYPICIGDILAGAYCVVHKLDTCIAF